MATAAVLTPSASGLSTPSDTQHLGNSQMEAELVDLQSQSFFTRKMVAILLDQGYDTSSINTLISRAEANTISADDIPSESLLSKDNSIAIKEFLDLDLLDAKKLRERNIYLNSNEPVLLLGFGSQLDLDIQQVRGLQGNVLFALRERGIKPVRVYVRETESDGLSFTLLNVVNSDIGVNMVTLLDCAFYGSDWKNELVVKEAWNGYDLIWKDEAWKSASEAEVFEPEVESIRCEQETPASAVEVSDYNEPALEVEQTSIVSQPITTEPQPRSDTAAQASRHKSVYDIPEDEDEAEPEPVQHPALKELLERDAQRPSVQYPTWSRSHDGEAYLDIIKTHSQGQGDFPTLSTISRSDAEKDDFEVVEKP